ncbi:bifunctional 5,10-methylenetetrahydrofolate dehydrogenase/5,10-methenyltetrahydrofolate cyclohydrolase [Candidatus Cryosericum terrychapinii]|jgi:methylenetetrahydrofolate dehydrogenase (NADP+)/methenyltetrahydrofolate cyclohydrolase|uniref:Bifunctional protein FolD n=1 Tax=Candidatus Cryosericum terrychapinii TaxID=2290919 RepID=A0A398CT30_9BACT|nr:tetrahydrofolate dehydrogenase/cyclohydrolase catalytic domain-containing protein [Candidatus Cryosericum terrychapinii]RIE05775.1 bifunctional 5,10-methylene-tetrahydrofolate dehydrogenase/5,10-methylene-tetrahydrofolate cyclohydrolase [Candidatus Cryosericum terrychapinii]
MGSIMEASLFTRKIEAEITKEVERLKSEGHNPSLSVIVVGNSPSTMVYFKNMSHKGVELGFYVELRKIDESIGAGEVLELIHKLNDSKDVDGILVGLPLPKEYDVDSVLHAISPNKDVDAFHPFNMGQLMIGKPHFVPATARSIISLLENYGVRIQGKNAVVVGRSNIVGKPVASLLLQRDATVTVCHSKTVDLAKYTREADILIVSMGRPRAITADYVKEGAVVIDVGINDVNGKIVGDVDFEGVRPKASLITPVPGGVGVLTTLMLFDNVLKAARFNSDKH